MPATADLAIQHNAPIPTWFGIGGGADRFARLSSTDDARRALELDPGLRVLGDGANLLVNDAGVSELVVALADPKHDSELTRWTFDDAQARVIAGAGANLPKLILEAVRRGLAGLEGLGGIPATVGGAAIMNAGGTFAQFCDVVARIHAIDRSGSAVTLDRSQIDFSYRRSGLNHLIVTSVELRLKREDPKRLRDRLREVMAYKKKSQPLSERSAGCVFKNPTLKEAIPEIGAPGARVSAGLLIDRAGCKGSAIGGAAVSERHGNFFVATRGCTARDMISLIEQVRERVAAKFGVSLEPEVIIWRRGN